MYSNYAVTDCVWRQVLFLYPIYRKEKLLKKKILALCDTEADYARNISAYLREKENFPYELHTYTDVDKLVEFGKKGSIDMLLVAESDYTYEVSNLPTGKTLLLNESGNLAGDNIHNIDKYQKAENIYREIAGEAAGLMEEKTPLLRTVRAKILGLYSPVRRCLQTSFALTIGQALSQKRKVLYLSFEHYAGWNQLLDTNVKGDLAALLYFLGESEERFAFRLQSIAMQIGKMYYVPPMYAGQNLIYVTGKEWQDLVEKIARLGGYDYLILDLSESIQGTFELLKMCDRIYTIIKDDESARSKLKQYEALLAEYECEEILDKTQKYVLPGFSRLPGRIEQFSRGELADYVRTLIQEDLEGEYMEHE